MLLLDIMVVLPLPTIAQQNKINQKLVILEDNTGTL